MNTAENMDIPDNVVRLDADKIEDLKRRRILREREEAIELEPPQPGETIVGYLTPEERLVFTEMAAVMEDINEHGREVTAQLYERTAQLARNSERPQDFHESASQMEVYPSKEMAEESFEMQSRLAVLRAEFGHSLRLRYGFGSLYGVRTNFAVVRTKTLYKVSDFVPGG